MLGNKEYGGSGGIPSEKEKESVMAQYRTSNGYNRRQQTYTTRGGIYVQGSTARRLEEAEEFRQPRKQLSHTARKNREKAGHMSLGYVLFLSAAMVLAGMILTRYIGLQSDITSSIKHISSLESELNALKLENDEEYSRITSSIDLEEVKRIAIQELGMRYAEEGQIVTFVGEGSDYVRQVADIPE